MASAYGAKVDRKLCAALAELAAVHVGDCLIQPQQIAGARYGDFERVVTDGDEPPAVRWRVRRAGWAVGGAVELRGRQLDAWRTAVAYGRQQAPAPDDLLLVPRPNGKAWNARIVRHAIRCGQRAAAGNGAAADSGRTA